METYQVAAKGFDKVRKGVKRGGVKQSSEEIKPVKNAYELAKEGKIHRRLYPENVNKPAKELKRSIKSLQQQIDAHKAKIADPKIGRPNWDVMPKEDRLNAIRHWRKEIKNFTEQRDIYQGILKNRKE